MKSKKSLISKVKKVSFDIYSKDSIVSQLCSFIAPDHCEVIGSVIHLVYMDDCLQQKTSETLTRIKEFSDEWNKVNGEDIRICSYSLDFEKSDIDDSEDTSFVLKIKLSEDV